MIPKRLTPLLLAWILAVVPSGTVRAAGIPVVDVAAIAQLVHQVQYWVQQIELMRTQLTQLQQTYSAMTGGRGMENLLAGTVRNYLPPDWDEVLRVANDASSSYRGLSSQVQAAMTANAVLTATQTGAMTPQQRQLVDDGRSAAAMLQVLSRAAYQNTSQRFGAIQRLIDVISRAGDMKAVMDLQARVQSEQAMLQNEQIKLQTLYQAAQAEQWAQEQRTREAAIDSIGKYRTGFHPSF